MLTIQAILESKTPDLTWVEEPLKPWTQNPLVFCPLAGVGCVYPHHYKHEIDCGAKSGVFIGAKWWNRDLPKDKFRNCTNESLDALYQSIGNIGVTWLTLDELKKATNYAWEWSDKYYKDFVSQRRTITLMKRLLFKGVQSRVIIGFKEVENVP